MSRLEAITTILLLTVLGYTTIRFGGSPLGIIPVPNIIIWPVVLELKHADRRTDGRVNP
jgi:hypothetical protein